MVGNGAALPVDDEDEDDGAVDDDEDDGVIVVASVLGFFGFFPSNSNSLLRCCDASVSMAPLLLSPIAATNDALLIKGQRLMMYAYHCHSLLAPTMHSLYHTNIHIPPYMHSIAINIALRWMTSRCVFVH